MADIRSSVYPETAHLRSRLDLPCARPYDARANGRRPPQRVARPKEYALEEPLTRSDTGIHALLFDFDGLLIDTESAVFAVWQSLFAQHGQRLALADWQHALGTHGGYDPAAHLAQLVGGTCDAAQIERAARSQEWQACRTLPLMPGVVPLLDDAQRLGLGLAVASSSPRDWVETLLRQQAVYERFGVLCTRENVTHVKPAPDLFLLAAERLGVLPSACLVFEDSPNGVRAARAAGMRCVVVPNGLTRRLPMPECELALDSLATASLATILARLAALGSGPAPSRRNDEDSRPQCPAPSLTEVAR